MSIFRKITPSILLLFISEVLLIFLFPGSTIIESTITAGGDTPSHFISAIAMSRGPASLFSPVTWIHGAFAGFPLFLHYFPLPFALMALISNGVSLQIAFKLVTLLADNPVAGRRLPVPPGPGLQAKHPCNWRCAVTPLSFHD